MGLQDLTPQLRTRLARAERAVGLFLGLALLLLVAGFAYYLYRTADRKGWFVPKAHFYTFLTTAEGLAVRDPINLAGFVVGEITVIDAEPPGAERPVFLGFTIRRPYYGYVWSDSKVKVVAAEFFGRRQIEVTAGHVGKPTVREEDGKVAEVLEGDGYVPVADASKGRLVEADETPALTTRATELMTQIQDDVIPRVLAIADDAQRVLANTEHLSARLDDLTGRMEPVADNLAAISTRLREPKGSLGEWLIPPDVHQQLSTTLESANGHLDRVAAQLEHTLGNLADMTGALNQQVQSNDQILGEISQLVVQTDDLVQGLKRHWLLRSAFPQAGATPSPPLLEPALAPPEPR